MTKKEFKKIDSKGREETWEWEETPEVTEALKRLHQDMREQNDS
jgi:hypothetical protein|tara:strand:+ start:145 stop:276 length:132 start_codon:yes stop_codon:yes gene_type:complete